MLFRPMLDVKLTGPVRAALARKAHHLTTSISREAYDGEV
jgi:hypothetical protein